LIYRLFISFESKGADANQIFSLWPPRPARKFLKETLHFLKCLAISPQLVKAIPGPEEGSFSHGMGWGFFMGLMKKSMPFFISPLLEFNPATGVEGIVIEFTPRIFFNHLMKV
jgi:hypothetical protein